jgi:hypothetical protein
MERFGKIWKDLRVEDFCGNENFAGKSVLGSVFHLIAEMCFLFLQTDSLIFV